MPSRTYSRVKSSAFKIWSFHCNKSISIGTRPQDLSSGLRPMQHSISFKTSFIRAGLSSLYKTATRFKNVVDNGQSIGSV